MEGYLHSIETFGSVDGPGVRFIAFLSGCTMRCKYCHNPDTWQMKGEKIEARDLLKKALRYKAYWKNNGGITVSGGEPMLQCEFVTEFFELAKKEGIHTTLDTSGQPWDKNDKKFEKLLEVTDLVILDIKETDDYAHRELTGHSNKNIIEFAQHLSEIGEPMWIRHVLVPGLTDRKESLEELKKLINSLKTVEKTEILPYHTFGIHKWEKLGIEYELKDIKPPTKEETYAAERLLKE